MDEYVKWDRWTVLPRIPGNDKQASFIKSAEDPYFTQFTICAMNSGKKRVRRGKAATPHSLFA